jgi:hypothetical protein
MPAYFACWEPHLGLHPGADGNAERFHAILTAREPPSPKMLAFADFLLARYPDLTETEDTIWADGPLKNNISGSLIYFTVTWSGYTEGRLFVRPAARMHGLDFHDLQANLYIPAERND